MFERPTVFIIGAGASKEINLPLGSELTKRISSSLNFNSNSFDHLTSGDKCIFQAAEIKQNLDKSNRIHPYLEAGRKISQGMIQAISIDNFLHAHADDPKIVWMGKLAIAQCILKAERSSHLSAQGSQQPLTELSKVEDTWLYVFFNMLHEEIKKTSLEKIFENISIVTFNYDRAIEHFLKISLVNYYNIKMSDAVHLVSQLRIEHPYGQVGHLPWQSNENSVEYGKEVDGALLHNIASQIRTFTERENDEMIVRTRELIKRAEVVVFLGFSYGRMNMDLISVKPANASEVYGTSFGISDPNKSVIHDDILRSLRNSNSPLRKINLANLTCKQFLKDYREPILRGVRRKRT
ncbi:hypothetical protein SAMN04488061_2856 [Filomicrobium insigne]|uniref:SIR2-like domain-containing protein n=2 Tax=Filomicrobium insigne TaxID=418854 RepID=A0A1H0SDW4_9HYPH|nr:hypothetical protein SAMN04488061_2856 [Filomicrobium insigne]